MSEQIIQNPSSVPPHKTYIKPAITHELKLETRAGSPLPTAIPPLVDPLGLDPNKQP